MKTIKIYREKYQKIADESIKKIYAIEKDCNKQTSKCEREKY